ncbi:MAG: Gfo/Idh/MocA family protein [Alphaproteobacteria bacterium]
MAVGVGILGAGMISALHGDALKNSQKAELVAVCDMDESRAKKLAGDFAPGAAIYTKLDDMLADSKIEIVEIVTPNHLHCEAVLAAAKAGKHVLCEKPPAMSLKDVDDMINACKSSGLKFGIFVQCRVREAIEYMKKALAAGRFGRILRADAMMKWHRTTEYYHSDVWRSQRRNGAGVTIQHAFHYIDLLQYLMGPVKSVEARMCNLAHRDMELEDTLDANIVFESGAIGSISASTALWPGTDVRLEIYGEKGAAIAEGAAFSLWQFQDEIPEDEAIRDAGDADQQTAGSSPTALASIDHQIIIDDCVDAIAENREVIIPCASVRPSLEMALAMYKSDKLKSPVELPLGADEDIW